MKHYFWIIGMRNVSDCQEGFYDTLGALYFIMSCMHMGVFHINNTLLKS